MRENIKQKDKKPKTGGSYPQKNLRLFSKIIILPVSNMFSYNTKERAVFAICFLLKIH